MNSKNIARIALGSMMIVAGISHFTFARKAFQAQVPDWVPLKKDDTVIYSGVAEVALGAGLIAVPKKHHSLFGKLLALFFIAIFPGNIAQYKNRRDAFVLNTDKSRLARLFMQPALVAWALFSTKK